MVERQGIAPVGAADLVAGATKTCQFGIGRATVASTMLPSPPGRLQPLEPEARSRARCQGLIHRLQHGGPEAPSLI